MLETQGSFGYAGIAFGLHLLALCAMLGATAHTLHFLCSEIYLGQYLQKPPTGTYLWGEPSTVHPRIAEESRALAVIPAILLIALVLISSLALAIAILGSALNSHAQARQCLRILWQTDGHLCVRLLAENYSSLLPHQNDLHCRLEHGCYSSHWLVILHLSHSREPGHRGRPPRRERFCILLARDSMANRHFRKLRLWMRLVAPNQLTHASDQSNL